jgi:hypothetical protein
VSLPNLIWDTVLSPRYVVASSSTMGGSSSKSLMWMMIALFSGLGVMIAGGIVMANRLVGNFGLAAASNKGTIRTPAGSFRLEKEDETGPTLPIYPNAMLVLPDQKSAALAIQERKQGISSVTYQTHDTRATVDLWYQQNLGPEFARKDSGDKPLPEVFRNAHLADSDIAFIAERGRQVRVVALSMDATGTSVSLLRFDRSPGQ